MLSIHSIGMAAVVGLLLVLDFRVLGYANGIPIAELRKYMPYAWGGFFVNLVSGALLFASTATRLLNNWPFIAKMICIVIAGFVSFSLWRNLGWSNPAAVAGGGTADAPVTTRAKQIAFASIVLWIAAIVFGRLIAYIMDHAILNGE